MGLPARRPPRSPMDAAWSGHTRIRGSAYAYRTSARRFASSTTFSGHVSDIRCKLEHARRPLQKRTSLQPLVRGSSQRGDLNQNDQQCDRAEACLAVLVVQAQHREPATWRAAKTHEQE